MLKLSINGTVEKVERGGCYGGWVDVFVIRNGWRMKCHSLPVRFVDAQATGEGDYLQERGHTYLFVEGSK